MKSVLISIQPKWCELIVGGEKTIEVRKNAPKLETPIKCYIYETKAKYKKGVGAFFYGIELHGTAQGSGKVIGEFVCDRIEETKDYTVGIGKEEHYLLCGGVLEGTCLTGKEMYDYGKGKPLYGWHISDLKIYDEPKELSEFLFPCTQSKLCEKCCFGINDETVFESESIGCDRQVRRPPQSWCYVEEL